MKKKSKPNLTNKNKIIIIAISIIIVFLVVFSLKNSSFINRLFANVNSSNRDYFEDDYFYSLVINSYNNENNANKKYSDVLTDEELASIKEIISSDMQGDGFNFLKSAKGIEKLTGLTKLDLSNNLLKEIDLSNNTKLTKVDLSYNSLTSINFGKNDNLTSLDLSDNYLDTIDISGLKSLSRIDLKDNPVFLDINLSVGESFEVSDNIILPSGSDITYTIDDNNVATLDGNVVTAVSNGNASITTHLGENLTISRKILVGDIVLSTNYSNVVINEEKQYIYLRGYPEEDITDNNFRHGFSTNIGTLKFNNNKMYLMANSGILKEYDFVYIDTVSMYNDDPYIFYSSSVNNIKEFDSKAINCTYEVSNNKLIVKYKGEIIDELNIIYIYLPESYILTDTVLFSLNKIIDESNINIINNINEIDKNKINILSDGKTTVRITTVFDQGVKSLEFSWDDSQEIKKYFTLASLHSNRYDLSKDYIYAKDNNFILDLSIGIEFFNSSINEFELNEISSEQLFSVGALRLNNNYMELYFGFSTFSKVKQWKFVEPISDKYDLSSDTIDLGDDEFLDTSSIDIKNGTISIEGDTLVIKYEDEIVDEIKIIGGKKTTTKETTKSNTEKKEETTSSAITTTVKETTRDNTVEEKTIDEENKTETRRNTTKNNTVTSETTTSAKNIAVSSKHTTTKMIKGESEIENKQTNIQNKVHNNKRIIIVIVNIINLILLVLLFSIIYKKYKKQ